MSWLYSTMGFGFQVLRITVPLQAVLGLVGLALWVASFFVTWPNENLLSTVVNAFQWPLSQLSEKQHPIYWLLVAAGHFIGFTIQANLQKKMAYFLIRNEKSEMKIREHKQHLKKMQETKEQALKTEALNRKGKHYAALVYVYYPVGSGANYYNAFHAHSKQAIECPLQNGRSLFIFKNSEQALKYCKKATLSLLQAAPHQRPQHKLFLDYAPVPQTIDETQQTFYRQNMDDYINMKHQEANVCSVAFLREYQKKKPQEKLRHHSLGTFIFKGSRESKELFGLQLAE